MLCTRVDTLLLDKASRLDADQSIRICKSRGAGSANKLLHVVGYKNGHANWLCPGQPGFDYATVVRASACCLGPGEQKKRRCSPCARCMLVAVILFQDKPVPSGSREAGFRSIVVRQSTMLAVTNPKWRLVACHSTQGRRKTGAQDCAPVLTPISQWQLSYCQR